jgi:outer membrane protein TolC
MKLHKIYIITAFFFGFISASSQTLEDYLKIAAENNPALKSRFYSYQAALEKVPQAGALPDPQLSFGIFLEPMERYMGNQTAEVSVMQMFPWFGTLAAAEEEMTAMAKARYEEFNEAKSMLFYEVKAAYYAIYLLQKEISITKESLRILNSIEEIALSRLKSGTTGNTGNQQGNQEMRRDQSSGTTSDMGGMEMQRQSPQRSSAGTQSMSSMNQMSGSNSSMVDVLRIQIEVNELNNNLHTLHTSLHHLLTQFNTLLNRKPDEYVNIPDTISAVKLPVPVSELHDSIKLNNPMLRMLQREEEAYLAQQKMNKRMGLPMIGIGLQYSVFQSRPGTMMEAKNMLMPMVSVSLPIWRGKYNASVRESGLLHDAAAEQRISTGNQVIANYQDAVMDYRDAERRDQFFRQQSSLAQQVADILTVQYTTAGSDFEEILRMQQQLLDYRLRSLDAVVDMNIAAAILERLMGR